MGLCSAKNCLSKHGCGIVLKRLPAKESVRREWIKNINRPNLHFGPNTYVCELHFPSSQWQLDGGKKVLKRDAVPTEFCWCPSTKEKPRPPLQNISNDQQYVSSHFDPAYLLESGDENEAPKNAPENQSKRGRKPKVSCICHPNSCPFGMPRPPPTAPVNSTFTPLTSAPISDFSPVSDQEPEAASMSDSALIPRTSAPISDFSSVSDQGPGQAASIPDSAVIPRISAPISDFSAASGQGPAQATIIPDSALIPRTSAPISDFSPVSDQGQAQATIITDSALIPRTSAPISDFSPVSDQVGNPGSGIMNAVKIVTLNTERDELSKNNFFLKRRVEQLLRENTRLKFTVKRLRSDKWSLAAKLKRSEKRVDNIVKILGNCFGRDQLIALGRGGHLRGISWTSKTIKKSLRIRFAARRAGHKVVSKTQMPLPSDRVMQRSVQHIVFRPGISNIEIYMPAKIQALTEINPFFDEALLNFDEMALKPAREFDVSTKTMVGFCTLPGAKPRITAEIRGEFNNDQMAIEAYRKSVSEAMLHQKAEKAMIFVLAGVLHRWKQIFAYHFTGKSVDSLSLKDFVWEILRVCYHMELNSERLYAIWETKHSCETWVSPLGKPLAKTGSRIPLWRVKSFTSFQTLLMFLRMVSKCGGDTEGDITLAISRTPKCIPNVFHVFPTYSTCIPRHFFQSFLPIFIVSHSFSFFFFKSM